MIWPSSPARTASATAQTITATRMRRPLHSRCSPAVVSDSGIIERTTDVDVFAFATDAGTIRLDVNPLARGPNLDVLAQLYDASLTLIASSNPADLLNASLTATVSAGEYYLHVSGVGKGDPLATGYTDYGSLGQYWVSGTILPVDNDFLSIAATDARQGRGGLGPDITHLHRQPHGQSRPVDDRRFFGGRQRRSGGGRRRLRSAVYCPAAR